MTLYGILDVVYKPLSFILKMKDSVISSAFEIVRNVNPELAKQGTSLRRELAILSCTSQRCQCIPERAGGQPLRKDDRIL